MLLYTISHFFKYEQMNGSSSRYFSGAIEIFHQFCTVFTFIDAWGMVAHSAPFVRRVAGSNPALDAS